MGLLDVATWTLPGPRDGQRAALGAVLALSWSRRLRTSKLGREHSHSFLSDPSKASGGATMFRDCVGLHDAKALIWPALLWDARALPGQ